MKPIFCGNFRVLTRQSDLEKLFSKYGKILQIDMKLGFAFVYFEDENHARDAIHGLNGMIFGDRSLSVEWARDNRCNRRPNKTLFVENFDPPPVSSEGDLERHFAPHGRVLKVRIRRNFAFVDFETLEDAKNAWAHAHMSKFLDRVISVNYYVERVGRHGPSRRSPSPVYGRGRLRGSPCYRRYDGPSNSRARSPYHGRYRSRSPVRRSRT